nr:hypothetical protein [uncultured Gemmiger sp.]
MSKKQPLLEMLCAFMECDYLSDLRFLSRGQRRRLAGKLERLPVQEEDLREWNDALEYLTQSPPQPTARAARDRLVQQLCNG